MAAISLFPLKPTSYIEHIFTVNFILRAALDLVGYSYLYAYLNLPEFFSLI